MLGRWVAGLMDWEVVANQTGIARRVYVQRVGALNLVDVFVARASG